MSAPRPDRPVPDRAETEALAELFHQVSDPTRLRLLMELLDGERCVCDLAGETSVSVSAVSHQLRSLRTARLVLGRREGRHVFYRLADDHVAVLVTTGLEHVRE
jgi:ArsR family transcriptional regulator, lead/cadmium/zinc/bismuth-responsive transcriptional repressor